MTSSLEECNSLDSYTTKDKEIESENNSMLYQIKPNLEKYNSLATYIDTKHNKPNLSKTNLPSYTYLPDMDTSGVKKSLRASLTEQYEARVAETTEKIDPNRAKANAILKDDEMEVEPLTGCVDAFKEPLPQGERQLHGRAAPNSARANARSYWR